jgi:hypothetical protein
MLLAFALVLGAAACGSDDPESADDTGSGSGDTTDTLPDGPSGVTINVPEDHETIQAAVDAASPGDLILIAEGTYNEAVDVTTENLTIRGLDRNEVVLDGEFTLENGIRVLADGVAVENMTAQNYTTNGFFWTGVTGYRGSYLTAYRNGDYGIYAFDSVQGQLDHSYGSGSPDAGFYIGQCYPCDAVMFDVISEYNGLGYSGTNAGGNLLIVNSRFNNNRAGIVPNSGSYELCYPERETTIVGNVVYDNNQPDTPAIDVALLAMGNGILLAGGVRNEVERNLVFDHDRGGIALVPFPEEQANDVVPPEDTWDLPCEETRDDIPDADPADLELVLWDSAQNRVVGNVVSGSGLGDIAVGTLSDDPASLQNCFSDNTFETSAPLDLEVLAPCDGDAPAGGDWSAGAFDLVSLIATEQPPSVDYETAPTPEPPDQPNMPDAATAPARPATGGPMSIDLDAIEVPARPDGT